MAAPDDSTALAFLIERIPQYPQYGDEPERRTSDTLVRSYVGEALALARDRFAADLREPLDRELETLLMHCQFSDQIFIKNLEHADVDAALQARLVSSDRDLVEHADRVREAAFAEFASLVALIQADFVARSAIVAKK